MLVGGRWSGWSRARAHTVAYTRTYFFIGLLLVAFGPAVIVHLLSMIVVVPGAFVANLLFVRLFPKRSWIREPARAWGAAIVGVASAWIGSWIWLAEGGKPPDTLALLGDWATAIYFVSIPVLFSNLGVLFGYLMPCARSSRSSSYREPPIGSSWPP